jgi:hypothetical protein
MNYTLIERIIKAIETRPDNFDMGNWAYNPQVLKEWATAEIPLGEDGRCGTTFCVAGWARQLAGLKTFFVPNNSNLLDEDGDVIDFVGEGAELMGLDEDIAYDLFNRTEFTRKQIVYVLNEMLAHPEAAVEWIAYEAIIEEAWRLAEVDA